ncbi:putative transcriptional regulator [Desulfitobacterium dehalogenans ATCC 51507]|uniref:Putative transcriptional regulator n=1 Tax=Desulfitobacterium dehalogenans (strain ATCC 51507 / DSM 9161 / JW/IU-DC1) TaxID=756499 RepID=I4AAG2_DESDJ|nr:helix-turn-helix transcriptional regulator [Desulfitobacterium dehalogenans]AFM00947.1 putative transcriptional regulator [Desulfitobacterium dehalogenans ATCC 51507]
MTLGEKIQQLRKAAGISQEQLAEQLDVSRQSISKWELNDAVPEISRIVMLSELFSISIDELLKDSNSQRIDDIEGKRSTSTLEEITIMNAANKQTNIGFKTIIIGLIMLVLEFMFLPILGTMQKAHVDGQGFYSDFMKYAGMQPMPLIFMLTAMIILIGIFFLLKGLMHKKSNPTKSA